MQTFKFDNIPVPQVSVSAKVDRDKNRIILTEMLLDHVVEETIKLKEKACRAALIELGWMPPETGRVLVSTIEGIKRECDLEYPMVMEITDLCKIAIAHIAATEPADE